MFLVRVDLLERLFINHAPPPSLLLNDVAPGLVLNVIRIADLVSSYALLEEFSTSESEGLAHLRF